MWTRRDGPGEYLEHNGAEWRFWDVVCGNWEVKLDFQPFQHGILNGVKIRKSQVSLENNNKKKFLHASFE